MVASRTSATYSWNVLEGIHVTLDKPAGIDHDCSNGRNPFFGSKGDAVCAGHVFSVNKLEVMFHAPLESANQTFRVEHVGVEENVPFSPSTCPTGVSGPPDNLCSVVHLTDLEDGFHSMKIIALDSVTKDDLTTAPTWANWTVDTQIPTVQIDTSAHPVDCDGGQFESGRCKTHLATATFGATSNEESIFIYAIDPPGGTPRIAILTYGSLHRIKLIPVLGMKSRTKVLHAIHRLPNVMVQQKRHKVFMWRSHQETTLS